MPNYQVVVISLIDGEIIRLIKTDHIDAVKSHTVFYNQHTNYSRYYKIFDELLHVVVADKKVTLIYPNCYAEITKI